VFKITPSGTLTTLYSFNPQGGYVAPSAVIQATNGDLYGTTEFGTAGFSFCYPDCGSVFALSAQGVFTTLHTFTGPPTDGFYPHAGLVQGKDGNLYGTTSEGGDVLYDCSSDGVGFGCGTVFRVTPGGRLTILHNFGIGTDGQLPAAGLVQATDGNLYGTTEFGGTSTTCNPGFFLTGCGTIFEITPQGKEMTLHLFHGSDGATPKAGLLQATNGLFYGTTAIGGAVESYGTVFSLNAGLGPFVSALPTAGAAGKSVAILGNNLTGASKVTFNGSAATFTVVSDTEITTSVPAGATTGPVQVVTPSGTLTSNVNFKVLP